MTQSGRAFRHLSQGTSVNHKTVALPVNENDEERMLRHKGDLPTTKTDTNNISVHREREREK